LECKELSVDGGGVEGQQASSSRTLTWYLVAIVLTEKVFAVPCVVEIVAEFNGAT